MTTVRRVLDYLSYDIEILISDRQTDCGATTFAMRSSDNVTTSATESHVISEILSVVRVYRAEDKSEMKGNDTDATVVEDVRSRVQRATLNSTRLNYVGEARSRESFKLRM